MLLYFSHSLFFFFRCFKIALFEGLLECHSFSFTDKAPFSGFPSGLLVESTSPGLLLSSQLLLAQHDSYKSCVSQDLVSGAWAPTQPTPAHVKAL